VEPLQLKGVASRRSSFEMMCDILKIVGRGIEKPTLIAYRCNLSWSVLTKYLEFMASRGLIERKKSSKRWSYSLTDRGREVLLLYKGICEGLGEAWTPAYPFTGEVELPVAAPA